MNFFFKKRKMYNRLNLFLIIFFISEMNATKIKVRLKITIKVEVYKILKVISNFGDGKLVFGSEDMVKNYISLAEDPRGSTTT